jgi:hypothetical protein
MFSSEGGKAGIFQLSGYQLHNDEREVIKEKIFIFILKPLIIGPVL